MILALEGRNHIGVNAGVSVMIYARPAALMFAGFYFTGEQPWTQSPNQKTAHSLQDALQHLSNYGLLALPWLLPGLKNLFAWVPFWWSFFIICIADDLTQYWYHHVHHQVPWLWPFHRTHHSAPYMGMAMTSRQNFLYTVFLSQTYLTATLVYF